MNWLLVLVVPVGIGVWAQMRVNRAVRVWGAALIDANITGATAAREMLTASKILDVEVVETTAKGEGG